MGVGSLLSGGVYAAAFVLHAVRFCAQTAVFVHGKERHVARAVVRHRQKLFAPVQGQVTGTLPGHPPGIHMRQASVIVDGKRRYGRIVRAARFVNGVKAAFRPG